MPHAPVPQPPLAVTWFLPTPVVLLVLPAQPCVDLLRDADLDVAPAYHDDLQSRICAWLI
jgi:hypothetical protein